MEILGFVASIFIGISLGLIGSGGSILTVPVLVYLFGVDAVVATSYSLFVVGITTSVGTLANYRKGLVNTKTALLFGAPSILAVILSRRFLVPALPEVILNTGSFTIHKGQLLLLLFATLMLYSSYKMIRRVKRTENENPKTQAFSYPAIILKGLLVGTVTGMVGAGGGFLIIPVLVLYFKLQIKEAIGTSLLIICANSLLGFFFSVQNEIPIQWGLLILVSCAAMAGIFVGIMLSKKISGSKLKPMFGWFVLSMGLYIILKETVL